MENYHEKHWIGARLNDIQGSFPTPTLVKNGFSNIILSEVENEGSRIISCSAAKMAKVTDSIANQLFP